MTKNQMIEDIIDIQYYVKITVFGEEIKDKSEYAENIKNVYKYINIDEIKENYEEVRCLGVGAIKSGLEHNSHINYLNKKHKAYEEYLHKCEIIELEKEEELSNVKELKELNVDCIVEYIKEKESILNGK
ncbi:MAG: hypothetical protein ACRDDY_02295 [Clostridium sp.]|uniref:hypothetical protein n=1 Tax=Clostridium sp. TaxID=1506 RepID=UPI003EE76A73